MAVVRWRIALTVRAQQDAEDIASWTAENFGRAQADVYAHLIHVTIRELECGPNPVGVKQRDDILPGLRLVHVARFGRRGRHFVLFRTMKCVEPTIEVLRVLHDQMDLVRHLPAP